MLDFFKKVGCDTPSVGKADVLVWPASDLSERPVPVEVDDESRRLVAAFSVENSSSQFDWTELYGRGFDITKIG